MAPKRKKTRKKTRIQLKSYDFCKDGKFPTYKDLDVLEQFLTERGKMVPRSRTGVSAKCQRHITQAIKRARELALLPFIVRA